MKEKSGCWWSRRLQAPAFHISVVSWEEWRDRLPRVFRVRDPLLVCVGFFGIARAADDYRARRLACGFSSPWRPAHGGAISFRDEFPAVSALWCHRIKAANQQLQTTPGRCSLVIAWVRPPACLTCDVRRSICPSGFASSIQTPSVAPGFSSRLPQIPLGS